MTEELRKIIKWIKEREIEDPIPSKSRYRVYRTMAKDIRRIKPLNPGNCHLCGNWSERLVPIQMKCCRKCTEKFLKHGGGLKILKREIVDYYCDNCLQRAFDVLLINPFVCEKCMRRIGRKHRFGLKDMKKQMEKDKKTIPYIRFR